MNQIKIGKCHCSTIEFEVELINGLEEVRRCNCSLCRRKGAIIASVSVEKLKVIKGGDKLSLYQWNSMEAKHYFCSVCGIYTHHQRRSNPLEFGFNIACIEGINPFDYEGQVKIGNGAEQKLV